MIKTYKKIKDNNNNIQQQFSMPTSLKLIKECASVGIDWHAIHIIDLMSLIYSIRIDNANRYLEQKRQEQMQKHGIKEIKKASEDDFNNL